VPVGIGADAQQRRVVLGAVRLDVRGQIEERLRQAAALSQEQRDEQAADTAVAVEERVDRLELLVHEGALDEIGQARPVLQEELPGGERGHHLIDRRWHVGGGRQRGSRRTDPVLRAAELARSHVRAAHATHEALVQFPDETQGQRQVMETLEAVLERIDVVPHLAQVGRIAARRNDRHLVHEELRQRGTGALDA